MTDNKIERIARVCHEVNRAYCQALGDMSQPTWADAPEWQRSSARMGVDLHTMGDFGPEASHISSARMADNPVRVGVLSRFVDKAEQSEVLAGLKEGKVDIVVGTHRLLSKDVHFKHLGLLVVDEEQRFGV